VLITLAAQTAQGGGRHAGSQRVPAAIDGMPP
jgi:hypothetical protein